MYEALLRERMDADQNAALDEALDEASAMSDVAVDPMARAELERAYGGEVG